MNEHTPNRPPGGPPPIEPIRNVPQFGNIRDASEAVQRLVAQASEVLERIDLAVIAVRQRGVDFSLQAILPNPTIRVKIADDDLPGAPPFDFESFASAAASMFEPPIDRLTRKQRKELGLTLRAVRLEARAMRQDGTWDALDNDSRAEAVKLRLQSSRVAAYNEYAADIDWDQVMVWIQFIVQIISMFMAIFMFI